VRVAEHVALRDGVVERDDLVEARALRGEARRELAELGDLLARRAGDGADRGALRVEPLLELGGGGGERAARRRRRP